MADEATQAPDAGQDTPTDSAPPDSGDTREATPPTDVDTGDEQPESIDFEKRYNDLRPEYDRTKAELKEAQQARELVAALQSDDPNERAWAAGLLGIEFDEEDDDTPDDDEQFRDPRVDELLQQREQEQHEQQLRQLEEHIDSEIDALDKKNKTSLDETEKEWVWSRALALPPNDQGMPDVAKAFEEFTGIADSRIKRYRDSKRDAPTAPVGGGESGSTQVKPGDRKSRLARANEVAQKALMREQ